MIHPLFRLIATRPHMVAEHVAAYTDLVAEEANAFTTSLKTRAVLGVIALVTAAIALMLIGMAALLWAAIPVSQMNVAWALIAIPAAPLIISIGCAIAIKQSATAQGFKAVREQFAADVALLREASGAA